MKGRPIKKSAHPHKNSSGDGVSARFLRVKQYADQLGISERTLREWIYSGVIPTIKVQRHLILIDPLKADAALQRLERTEVKV
jgi:excisionase family DNA binding protein